MTEPGSGVCALCGRSTDAHNRHVRFRLPDPVLALAEQEQTPGTWMSHGDPESSVMMQVPGVGPFVRSLLTVHLTDGFALIFGVWVAVHPDDLQRAYRVWWEPEYRDLVLRGYLGNALPKWGYLGSPVLIRVRDVEQTPYVTESGDEGLSGVLRDEWPHDVLDGLP